MDVIFTSEELKNYFTDNYHGKQPFSEQKENFLHQVFVPFT